jgi:hypothetical protein
MCDRGVDRWEFFRKQEPASIRCAVCSYRKIRIGLPAISRGTDFISARKHAAGDFKKILINISKPDLRGEKTGGGAIWKD